jgi:hypothetical protein
MKCPHCLENIHETFHQVNLCVPPPPGGLVTDVDGMWSAQSGLCPACKRAIIFLLAAKPGATQQRLVHPKGIARAPLSPDIPEEVATDYREACLVLTDSPKASAALSRRCLQHVLREKE